MSKIRDLENALANAVETFYNVNHLENAKKAFEEEKERITNKFKEEKEEIENLTDLYLPNQEGRIQINIYYPGKNKDGKGFYIQISFDSNSKEIKITHTPFDENDGLSPMGPHNIGKTKVVKIIKQDYDDTNEKYIYVEGNKEVDIFTTIVGVIKEGRLEIMNGRPNIIVVRRKVLAHVPLIIKVD